MKVLAGDIGGTKTLLQIAEVRGTHIKILHQARYSSLDYPDFESLLREFLDHAPATLRNTFTGACFGVAGPISGHEQGPRQANITNLPWRIEEAGLKELLKLARVRLINDFFATASGIDALGDDDIAVIHPAPPQLRAPRLVVGAGTGLGVAQLLWCENQYRAFASEGGHIHYAPTDALQMELLAFLQRRYERVSCERLVSGAGLVNIYEFLHHRENNGHEPKLHALLQSEDPAAAITDGARCGDLLAIQAISLFLTIFGAVIGDLALVTLAYGGIYVAGGIAPKLLGEIRDGKFLEFCMRKGRMSPLVLQMPVIVILSQDVGLRGAALVASQL